MASKGDVFSGLSSINGSAYLDIRPAASTNEAVIHNIYHADDISIYLYDGTNSLLFSTIADEGVEAYLSFHVTYTLRMRVLNTTGSAALIGYDGIYTK